MTSNVPAWDPEAEKARPGYLFQRMADHVAARIAAGEFPPDAMLPKEYDLVAEYQVSIDTVRRATQELRDRGLVVTYPSRGTFVTGQPE